LIDYYTILSKAVASLNPNTAQARASLFDRARETLVAQFRREHNSWHEDAAAAELERFDAATDRIENDIAQRLKAVTIDQPRRSRQEEFSASAESDALADLPRWKAKRVAFLSTMVGLIVALIVTAILVLRSGPLSMSGRQANNPAGTSADVAKRPEPENDELDPGVDGGSTEAGLPYYLRRQAVYYRTVHSEGMVVVDRSQRYLYLVQAQQRAVRYGVGIGGECSVGAGLYRIQRWAQWPDWSPTPALLRLRAYPAHVAGGPGNPLGAAALYFEDMKPTIHGTNSPKMIGQAPAIGCIRLVNDDIVDLEKRVQVGGRVVVLN
jgi:lipoprotein-anchoring transpeptidase ErfK/SrfK